jgi:hypothetical protein
LLFIVNRTNKVEARASVDWLAQGLF